MDLKTNYIYKILSSTEWEDASESEIIITELDKKDGFVHLSTAKQLSATLALYFSHCQEVILLRILSETLKDKLVYEYPDSKERTVKFPHYYGELKKSYIEKNWALKRRAFEVPKEILLEAEAQQ